MEIWIYNHLNDERRVVEVADDGDVTIGRDERNTIPLNSPFVSREHAKLFKDDTTYYVESLGLNGTTVANKNIAMHDRRKVTYGDEVRIGEFSLFMMEPSARRGRRGGDVVTPQRRLVELEEEIHEELLERLNLRVASQIAKADAQYAAIIKRHLAEIIGTHMDEVDDEMADTLVRDFLWRTVVTELNMRCTGRIMSVSYTHLTLPTN